MFSRLHRCLEDVKILIDSHSLGNDISCKKITTNKKTVLSIVDNLAGEMHVIADMVPDSHTDIRLVLLLTPEIPEQDRAFLEYLHYLVRITGGSHIGLKEESHDNNLVQYVAYVRFTWAREAELGTLLEMHLGYLRTFYARDRKSVV